MTDLRSQLMATSIIGRETFSRIVPSGNPVGGQLCVELAVLRAMHSRQLGFRIEDELHELLKKIRNE